jgi:hypothetical protein
MRKKVLSLTAVVVMLMTAFVLFAACGGETEKQRFDRSKAYFASSDTWTTGERDEVFENSPTVQDYFIFTASEPTRVVLALLFTTEAAATAFETTLRTTTPAGMVVHRSGRTVLNTTENALQFTRDVFNNVHQ